MSNDFDQVHRIADPTGMALIDQNVFGGWKQDVLNRLAKSTQIVVPDVFMIEALLNAASERREDLLQRLAVIKPIIAADMATHTRWEIAQRQPVGLLVYCDREGPQSMAARWFRSIGADRNLADDTMRTFKSEHDQPYQAHWDSGVQNVQKEFSAQHLRELRKMGRDRFLRSIGERPNELHSLLISTIMQLFIEPAVRIGHQPPPPDFYVRLDENWALYRAGRAFIEYLCIAAVEQPQRINRTRSNQRFDWHYVALLDPRMILLTRDAEMKAVATAVCPGVRGRVKSCVNCSGASCRSISLRHLRFLL